MYPALFCTLFYFIMYPISFYFLSLFLSHFLKNSTNPYSSHLELKNKPVSSLFYHQLIPCPPPSSPSMNSLKSTAYNIAKSIAVDKSWVKQDGWCSLCTEPFSNWAEHVSGRFRDHRCLEMFYDAISQQPLRMWNPRGMIYDAFRLPSVSSFPSLFAANAQKDDVTHKARLYASLCVLRDAGVFRDTFNVTQSLGNASMIKGSHYAPLHVMRLLMTIFPGYDCGYLSDLVQMICDTYNYESCYYAIAVNKLMEDVEMKTKTKPHNVLKALMGELYYTSVRRAGRISPNADICALSQYALMSCIAELMLQKIAEYVARADRVWRAENGAPVNNRTLRVNKCGLNTAHPTVSHPVYSNQIIATTDASSDLTHKPLTIHEENANRVRFRHLFYREPSRTDAECETFPYGR